MTQHILESKVIITLKSYSISIISNSPFQLILENGSIFPFLSSIWSLFQLLLYLYSLILISRSLPFLQTLSFLFTLISLVGWCLFEEVNPAVFRCRQGFHWLLISLIISEDIFQNQKGEFYTKEAKLYSWTGKIIPIVLQDTLFFRVPPSQGLVKTGSWSHCPNSVCSHKCPSLLFLQLFSVLKCPFLRRYLETIPPIRG